MPRFPVFVTRALPQEALARLQEEAEAVIWSDELPPSREAIRMGVQGAQGLLCLLTDTLDRDMLEAAPDLRVVSNLATGYDNVDVEAATRRGIPVGTTPGVLDKTTADFAFALLLATARRVLEGARQVHAGGWRTWHPLSLLGPDVHGAVLGIVGMGAIGLEVAKRALGFEMRVLYHNRTRRLQEEEQYGIEYISSLSGLLEAADFVSLHVPLTSRTHHLIGHDALARMKPSAILVNTARGPVVDTDALYQALAGGRLAGAGLDVTDPEPLPGDHPLLALDNVVVTPHIGSASRQTRLNMAMVAVENLIAGLKGVPMPHCVNPQALLRVQ